jgi:hypothetical protein
MFRVDTLKQKMYDIKMLFSLKDQMELVEIPFNSYYLLELGINLLVLLKDNKKKLKKKIYKTPMKSYQFARYLKKELWQKVKAIMSELTDIARNYIEESDKYSIMESTIEDELRELK